MKKYIIRYTDGSEQRFIRAKYNSRKEAEEALLIYLCDHNENCDDSGYLSPFDFTVEEVNAKDVNETITNFESAREALGLNIDYELPKYVTNVARLVEAITPTHIEALIALNELFTIAQAWNKEDKFVPDFSNRRQDKWIPWFDYSKNTARFMFINTFNAPTNAYTFGSRLCFKTSARAKQFGEQFEDLYNKVFL